MTLYLITAPSGAGKTTVAQDVMKQGLWIECISHTTRPMRDGEVDGVTYHFVDEKTFLHMKKDGKFAEDVMYDGNYYAVSHHEIGQKLEENENVFIIVDFNGYGQVKAMYPDAVGIFLHMSKEDCLANMLLRGDSMENAVRRIGKFDSEMENSGDFDYVIKNVRDRLEYTEVIIRNIIYQHNSRKSKSSKMMSADQAFHPIVVKQSDLYRGVSD